MQQQPQQPIYQNGQPQQTQQPIYQNGQPQQQVVYQPQPQVIYQPQPQVVYQQQVVVVDDPTCLYVSAVFGLIIPLIGLIMMCVYGCGQNLPPRQSQAFKVLVTTTIIGIIIGIILAATQ